MPKLRGHHLICLHFFNGEGYDQAFIKNLRHVLRQAEVKEITVTSGADDVCAACLHLKHDCCEYTDNADKEIQGMDGKALTFLGLTDSDMVRWDIIRVRMNDIFPQWYSLYCVECDWREVCKKNPFFHASCGRVK